MEASATGNEEVVVEPADLVRKLVSQQKLYDKEFKFWSDECVNIIRRYRCERGDSSDPEEDKYSWFNIFWASIQTAEPSLYCRTPIPQVERRNKDRNPLARVASEILERALKFQIGDYDFDQSVQMPVRDRLLLGRGTARIRYVPTIDIVDGTEQIVAESAVSEYVLWSDFSHNSARNWDEVTQVRFRSYLDKAEAAARFGKEKALKLQYSHLPKSVDDEKVFGAQEQDDFKKAVVWEVWDKPTKTVFWFSPDYKEGPLDTKQDPLGLKGFFPCPKPLYGTITGESLIPVPDARQCKRLYNLLDDIEGKIGALTEDLRVAGIYDAAMDEIEKLVYSRDKLIPVKNWMALKATGGLKDSIEFWPLQHVVSALEVLYQQKEQTKNDIYEVTGWADIMRGNTDPNETAAAQQLKGRFVSIRLTRNQMDVQRFARDLIALKGEVIAEHFGIKTLVQMTGMEFIDTPELPPDAQISPQQIEEYKFSIYQQAVELLRNDPLRRFQIDIETDSTIAMNESVEQQARADFMQSVSGFMQATVPMAQQMPTFMPLFGEMLSFVARTYKAGRNLDTAIEQFTEQVTKQIQENAKNPPPDPKQIELQIKAQEMQSKLQLEQFKAQTSMQLEQQKADHEMQLAQTKAQLEQEKAALANQTSVQETKNGILMEQIKLNAEIEIQKAQSAADIQLKALQAQLQAAVAAQKQAESQAKLVAEKVPEMPRARSTRSKTKRVTPMLDPRSGKKIYLVDSYEGEM